MTRSCLLLLLLLLPFLFPAVGCSSTPAGQCPAGELCDAAFPGPDTSTPRVDSAVIQDAAPDGGTIPEGELIIEQISIPGTTSGESALIIGPDGTSVLIDVGNGSHEAEIREAVTRRIGSWSVDWLIITHYHGDHYGAVDNLFDPSGDRIAVQRGVVTRGLFDVGEQAADSDFQELCTLHGSADWAGRVFDLCEGPEPAPCDGNTTGSPWPASSCDGLLRGDLEDPADDGQGHPSFLRLGKGARLTFFHANGRLIQNGAVISAEDDGVVLGHGGTEGENSRSLGGVVRWGDFFTSFDGDLTGAGDREVPDVEGWIASHAAGITDGPAGPLLIPPGDLDVAKLSHHGLASATQQSWVDWWFPSDGLSRTAVIGANLGYGTSPQGSVLDRLGARIFNGWIWITQAGLLGDSHPRRRDAGGAVVVRVTEGGALFEVFAWVGGAEQQNESYPSTPSTSN